MIVSSPRLCADSSSSRRLENNGSGMYSNRRDVVVVVGKKKQTTTIRSCSKRPDTVIEFAEKMEILQQKKMKIVK